MSSSRSPIFIKRDGVHDIIILFNTDDGMYYLTDSNDNYIINGGYKSLAVAALVANQYWYSFGCWSCD